jgi:hypothetical protein
MMVFIVTFDNSMYLVWAYALTKSPSATSDARKTLGEMLTLGRKYKSKEIGIFKKRRRKWKK